MHIVGFKDPNRIIEVEFSKEPISVIYGDNGCGKTTLLKLIYAVLSRNETILIEEKVQEIILEYSVYGEDGLESNKIIVRKTTEDIEDNFNWYGFDKEEPLNSSSILFGVQRGVTTNHAKIDPEIIEKIVLRSRYIRDFDNRMKVERFSQELAHYINDSLRVRRRPTISVKNRFRFDENHLLMDNINIETIEVELLDRYRLAKRITSERVQKALFDTLSLAIHPTNGKKKTGTKNLPADFYDLIALNKDRLIEALKASASNSLRDHIIEILQNYDKYEKEELFSNNSNNELLSSLLLKMILELESEQYILSSINDLIEMFNDQISSNKKLVVDQEEVYIDLGEGNRHGLTELSSGERHLLSFLTLFIIKGGNRNFLIIDEPEISLNIKWQRQLLPLLSRLVPNAQIIVASHSPSVAKENSNYLVKMVERSNQI